MAFGDIVDIFGIPYLAHAELPGRFITSLMFHDGDWRVWLQTQEGRFIEARAWPAEAFYFARTPESPEDFNSVFLNFLAQRANFRGFEILLSAIQDDIFNLSAALAKLDLISGEENGDHGKSRMAATEVEYILLICRSLFDLLQEFLAKLWGTVTLNDAATKKKALKKTFSGMTLHANTLKSADQISKEFHLPREIAECYARHAPIFLKIREFRDNLVHRGYQVQTIFRGDDGFLIEKRLGPFIDLSIWRDNEIQENNLVPLKPALALVVNGTLAACEDFARVLMACIKFPDPVVPHMSLFMRGYFNDALMKALVDSNRRLAEGKSLFPEPKKTAGSES